MTRGGQRSRCRSQLDRTADRGRNSCFLPDNLLSTAHKVFSGSFTGSDTFSIRFPEVHVPIDCCADDDITVYVCPIGTLPPPPFPVPPRDPRPPNFK
jgi:hypothetical protein